MAANPRLRLTAEEYLRLEREAEFKSEFVAGEVRAMAGAGLDHVEICSSLLGILRNELAGSPCRALAGDLKVRAGVDAGYFYPDLTILCGEPEFANETQEIVNNPTVLIEVLSPSTEAFDRGIKFAHYRTLSSLQAYVLVSQAEAALEVFARSEAGWVLSDYRGLDSSFTLPSLNVTLPLSEIYARVRFETAAS